MYNILVDSSVSVILNVYNKIYGLDEQIEAIKNQTIPPKEILIWQNKFQNDIFEVPTLDTPLTACCSDNLGVWARFYYALNATSDFILIYDDDTIPGENWHKNCLETFKKTPGIITGRGHRQQSNKYSDHRECGWPTPEDTACQVDYGNHCWFLKREWLPYMFLEPRYHHLAGEDMHLSFAFQKQGILTYTAPHPENDMSMWSSLKPEYGMNDLALVSQPQSIRRYQNAFKYYLKHGWKLICDYEKQV